MLVGVHNYLVLDYMWVEISLFKGYFQLRSIMQ